MRGRIPCVLCLVLVACEDPFWDIYDAGAVRDGGLQKGCVRLGSQPLISLPTTAPIGAVTTLGDDAALIVTARDLEDPDDPIYFRVTRDGIELLPLSLPGFLVKAAASIDDQIWLAGGLRNLSGSDVRVGNLDDGFQSLPPRPAATRSWWVRWIGVASSTTGPVLYALGDNGALDRFANGRWETVWATSELEYFTKGSIAVPSADEALWLSTDRHDIRRYHRAITSTITPRIGVTFTTLGLLAHGDVVVGVALDGHNVQFSNGEWHDLGPPSLDTRARAFVAEGDGFIYAGQHSYLQQYQPSVGYCDTQPGPSIDVTHIAPLGRDFLMVGNARSSDPLTKIGIVIREE